MNFETVYQVAKALPKGEQLLLLEKLKKDFKPIRKTGKKVKTVLTREEAIRYLLDNVFNKSQKKCNNRRLNVNRT